MPSYIARIPSLLNTLCNSSNTARLSLTSCKTSHIQITSMHSSGKPVFLSESIVSILVSPSFLDFFSTISSCRGKQSRAYTFPLVVTILAAGMVKTNAATIIQEALPLFYQVILFPLSQYVPPTKYTSPPWPPVAPNCVVGFMYWF